MPEIVHRASFPNVFIGETNRRLANLSLAFPKLLRLPMHGKSEPSRDPSTLEHVLI
jgi:hypothetical protein